MSQTISETLIQRMQASAHPDVDVRVIATEVTDWHARAPRKNPEGLFVSMVRKRSAQRQEADVRLAAVRGAEQERQARFWVGVLRLTATQQLSPGALAEMLAQSQATGVGRVGPRIIDQLRRLGGEWPK